MFSAQPPKRQGGKAPGCWKRHPLSFYSAGGQELLRLATLCQDASRHRGNPGKHQAGASHKARSGALPALALALTFPARKADVKRSATFPGPNYGQCTLERCKRPTPSCLGRSQDMPRNKNTKTESDEGPKRHEQELMGF